MSELPYTRIPEPPKKMTASSALARLVDGLGFRYRWGTEGLTEQDMAYKPCDTSMTINELLRHIHSLINVSESFITGKPFDKIGIEPLPERRRKTLETILRMREALLELDDEYLGNRMSRVPWAEKEFPLWNLINGPLSDALTHIGQIVSWRRMNGNPIIGGNVFTGEPPRTE